MSTDIPQTPLEPWEIIPYESDLEYVLYVSRGSTSTISGKWRPNPATLYLASNFDPDETIELTDVAMLDELITRLQHARVWLASQEQKAPP